MTDKKKEAKEKREESSDNRDLHMPGSHPAANHHNNLQPAHLPGASTTTPGTSLKEFHEHKVDGGVNAPVKERKLEDDESDEDDNGDDENDSETEKNNKENDDENDVEEGNEPDEVQGSTVLHERDIIIDEPQESFSTKRARENLNSNGG